MIYLDYSANTPADPAVLETFCRTEQTYIGNPNSTHGAGRAAQKEMTRITEHIARLMSVEPEEVIYTSGATESNNLAIKGIAQASRHLGKHIVSTALEHSSVGGGRCLRSNGRAMRSTWWISAATVSWTLPSCGRYCGEIPSWSL